jgi:spermidine synthase
MNPIMDDLTRFFDALSRLYGDTVRPQIKHILIVGPGYPCQPCEKLLDMFPHAHLDLVEVDQEAAGKLRQLASERMSVLQSDAANLSHIAPGPYDLILIRHPDIARNPAGWEAAFAACVAHIQPDSLLVTSVYSHTEANYIYQIMEQLPVSMLSGSPYTAVPVALKGNDRYILVYQLTETWT